MGVQPRASLELRFTSLDGEEHVVQIQLEFGVCEQTRQPYNCFSSTLESSVVTLFTRWHRSFSAQ